MKIVTITEEINNIIIETYKQEYSVSEVMKKCPKGIGRKRIENILKKFGIYEGLNGENYLKKKVEKHEKLMMEKYGVKNWGQTKDGGYKKQNKIPYKNISFLTDKYKEYRIRVEKETVKNIKKHFKIFPKYCYYTKILFADEEGPVNPNDPRKRSVDHKIPILHCYLNNISVEEASNINNIVFVLRYVNSVKAQTLEESFIPIVEKIRKVFINEGYESKKVKREI
jgi:hypothetical protein